MTNLHRPKLPTSSVDRTKRNLMNHICAHFPPIKCMLQKSYVVIEAYQVESTCLTAQKVARTAQTILTSNASQNQRPQAYARVGDGNNQNVGKTGIYGMDATQRGTQLRREGTVWISDGVHGVICENDQGKSAFQARHSFNDLFTRSFFLAGGYEMQHQLGVRGRLKQST